jgi:hypothetical protein
MAGVAKELTASGCAPRHCWMCDLLRTTRAVLDLDGVKGELQQLAANTAIARQSRPGVACVVRHAALGLRRRSRRPQPSDRQSVGLTSKVLIGVAPNCLQCSYSVSAAPGTPVEAPG